MVAKRATIRACGRSCCGESMMLVVTAERASRDEVVVKKVIIML